MTQFASVPAASARTLFRAFARIDWAFGASTPTPPHDIHPYPARFIPELPMAALGLIRHMEGPVLDPFCGAGTTVVEAIRDGREATGIDLNPIATLITRVKSERWKPTDEALAELYGNQLREAALEGNAAILAAARERIPRLDHWFTPDAQRVLAGSTAFIRLLTDPVWRDRLALAISASVVRLSRQESDTRYAAIDKRVMSTSAADSVQRSLAKVARQLRAFAVHHTGKPARVLTGDAATTVVGLDEDSFAAAVFSPPYPNAYEYWLYHKYRMYWLGFDPIAVRSAEIGARPHYSGSGRSTIETFRAQMAPVVGGLARCLMPDGICVVVVGDSMIKGTLHDNALLFRELGVDAGLNFVAEADRPIRATRKAFNLAVARIKSEHVLLFQKQ